jgi:pyruvate dehydrogenase E1 component alpha subunit
MPRRILETFNVEYMQVMDETGNIDEKLMPKMTASDIKRMYELMVLTRVFDDKAFKLQRQGRIGTYAQSLGQEAAQIGSAYALQTNDWVFPAFREHGVFLTRGMPMAQYLQYWSGDERGMHIPENVNMFTVSIPVGTHIPHAVGCAWAMKLKHEKAATAVYFGDGATSKGDFHEAMNFAGVLKAPCVFVCQNNQWAISVPVARQTAAQTLAQKAVAYGFSGIRVDGNDVFAVYAATKEALERARAGKGPTLIECLTYRMGDHTTSDDAKRYRTEEELEIWRKRDPILRLEKYMAKAGMISLKEKAKTWVDAESKVEQAVKEFEVMPKPNPEDAFHFAYAKMTAELEEQMNEVAGRENKTEVPGESKPVSGEDDDSIYDNDDSGDIVHAQ